MKFIFTFLACSLFSAFAFAGDITINVSNARLYNVVVDGRSIGTPYNAVTLQNLQPGRHFIEVYKQKKVFWENTRKIYSSYFIIKPQSDLYVNVDNTGRLTMDERYAYGNDNRNNRDNNDYGYGRRKRQNRNWDDDDRYEKKRHDQHSDGYDKDDDNKNRGYNKEYDNH